MPVPLLDVNAQNHPIREQLTAAFQRVMDTGHFILGQEVQAFEQEAAAFTETPFALGVSSGTDALLLAFMALELGPGDEVLCPSFTFFATAGCIARTGATPVFVDSCPVCYNLELTDLKAKITPATKAIVPVHLFGQCAEMDGLMEIAQEHNLRVIEDTAQSFGARYKNQMSGSIGDFGATSFFPSKNLGGLGDGGLLYTNDEELYHKARIMRVHGSEPKYHHHVIGGNFRLDALQAAFLRVKLNYYNGYTQARQTNAADYITQLSQVPGITQANPAHCHCATAQNQTLEDTKILLPVNYEHNSHIWNQFTIRVLGDGQRDALQAHLRAQNIGSEVYYPITMDQQKCFAHLPANARKPCPVAHQLAQEVLSIPVYPELGADQRQEVITAITDFVS